MPINLNHIVPDKQQAKVFAELLETIKTPSDYHFVSADKKYILTAFDIPDMNTGDIVMRLIITIYQNIKDNALEFMDMDLVLTDTVVCELTDLDRHTNSLEFWDSFEASCSERNMELETVNRCVLPPGKLQEPVRAYVSGFPFGYTLFQSEKALRDHLRTTLIPLLNDPEVKEIKEDLETDFTSLAANREGKETFTIMAAKIDGCKIVKVQLGSQTFDEAILSVSIKGISGLKLILPYNEETSEPLKDATYLTCLATMKADLAEGECDYIARQKS